MVTVILLLISIVTADPSSRTAERRGRSAKAWMWLGTVFGPFGWLAVALMPSMRTERTG